ncbi:MAG TPA: hypothetical protein VFV36_00245 [Candidatus Methylomirabilis sp.]|nr:hypothetical protein [Candidatus Methylomirabilis sp.]
MTAPDPVVGGYIVRTQHLLKRLEDLTGYSDRADGEPGVPSGVYLVPPRPGLVVYSFEFKDGGWIFVNWIDVDISLTGAALRHANFRVTLGDGS